MKLDKRVVAAAVMIAAAVYGLTLFLHRSTGAGGADSSGYLNEARMIAAGQTSVPIRLLSVLHLPSDYAYVFTPLGFAPSRRHPGRMVPTYPPGLPAHFAVAGIIGGWSQAPFLMPLIAGFVSIALLFVLARQFGLNTWQSAAACAILAVCPIFLFMTAQPMSDVFATMWTLAAIVCAIAAERKPSLALLAGAAFGISVCVRPSNLLAAIAIAFALRWRPSRLVLAVAAAIPFAIALMSWNYALYGNAIVTGYGEVGGLLSWGNARIRVPHYAYWLFAQLTPLVFPGGLLAGFDRRIDPFRRAVLVLWFVPFFTFYCFYEPYDTWWYTRFLLPAIPPLIIGFLLLIRNVRLRIAAFLVIVILFVAVRQDRKPLKPLNVGSEESIYPEIAARFGPELPRDAIIMNGLFSGSFLYYLDRDCVRYDQLDNDRFQLLRAYAMNANLRWYAVLPQHEWEEAKRFDAKWTKIDEYRGVLLLRLD
ncbi:MAG: glycosyltransferase family 39 protein [Acidobacteriota bacterium]|nr:glycosyltransferase family 39 protein [Acidobacteriota bacterium]